jgi:hypothetical protein
MFEDIRNLWKIYTERHVRGWQIDDPRLDLVSEVRDRLEELDIVLEYYQKALDVFRQTPSLSAQPPPTVADLLPSLRAAKEMPLFSEMFYYVAWRIVDVLGGDVPVAVEFED